jgi:hypothetical protein
MFLLKIAYSNNLLFPFKRVIYMKINIIYKFILIYLYKVIITPLYNANCLNPAIT